jgi:hypothetical protein
MTKRGTLTAPANKTPNIGINGINSINVYLTSSRLTSSDGLAPNYKICVGVYNDSDLGTISALVAAAAARDLGTCVTSSPGLDLGSLKDTHCCSYVGSNPEANFKIPSGAEEWSARIYSYVPSDANSTDHKIFYDAPPGTVNPNDL